MKIKISATFIGACNICKRKTKVFKMGDEESKLVVNVCDDCARKLGNESLESVIKKFGKINEKSFEKGIKKL